MEENENLREELNEEDTQNVSGGFIRYNNKGMFREEKTGKRYNRYCDFCGREIEGHGAFLVSKGRAQACIFCYEKLNKMNPSDFKAELSDLSDNEFA